MSIKAKIITGIIIVALAGSGGGYAWWRNQQADEQQQQEQADRAANEGRVTEEQASSSGEPSPDVHQSNTQISVTLNSPVNGQQFNGETVTVRTVLNGTTNGSCTVTFSRSGYEAVTASAPVVQAPTYYTCNGFDIAKSRFPVGGEWKVKVSVTAPNAEGTSEERTITIN